MQQQGLCWTPGGENHAGKKEANERVFPFRQAFLLTVPLASSTALIVLSHMVLKSMSAMLHMSL